jgi:hypothetical protein
MATPLTQQFSAGRALSRHEPLVALLGRLRDSQARLAAVQAVLPPGLASSVEAGPLDDETWMLLVHHAAAGAKLRQCVPALDAALAAAGFAPRQLRIKLSPRAAAAAGK